MRTVCLTFRLCGKDNPPVNSLDLISLLLNSNSIMQDTGQLQERKKGERSTSARRTVNAGLCITAMMNKLFTYVHCVLLRELYVRMLPGARHYQGLHWPFQTLRPALRSSYKCCLGPPDAGHRHVSPQRSVNRDINEAVAGPSPSNSQRGLSLQVHQELLDVLVGSWDHPSLSVAGLGWRVGTGPFSRPQLPTFQAEVAEEHQLNGKKKNKLLSYIFQDWPI